jgi:hypothetical protein
MCKFLANISFWTINQLFWPPELCFSCNVLRNATSSRNTFYLCVSVSNFFLYIQRYFITAYFFAMTGMHWFWVKLLNNVLTFYSDSLSHSVVDRLFHCYSLHWFNANHWIVFMWIEFIWVEGNIKSNYCYRLTVGVNYCIIVCRFMVFYFFTFS